MVQAARNTEQVATFGITAGTGGKIAQNRKEKHFYKQWSAVSTDFRGVVTLRLYGTNKIYACLWINDSKSGIYTAGGGNASGYGYHKASAAAQAAFDNAGVKLSLDIDGRGDSAIETAINATMTALGYKKFGIIEAHA